MQSPHESLHLQQEFDKQNYFTPEVGDFFVGMEVEWKMPRLEWSFYKDESCYTWQPYIITLEDFNGHDLSSEWHNIQYGTCEWRVPFLTAEQLGEEDWEYSTIYRDGGTSIYEKIVGEKEYELAFSATNRMTPSKRIRISDVTESFGRKSDRMLFDGDCKCINTLRVIEKLIKTA